MSTTPCRDPFGRGRRFHQTGTGPARGGTGQGGCLRRCVAVGDSTWDFLAAGKLGLRGIAVRTGGFGVEELRAAGAELVFDSLPELTDQLSRTALHGRA